VLEEVSQEMKQMSSPNH